MILALVLAAVAETSTIAIPIRTTLTPLLPSIEAQVPKTFKSSVVEGGVEIEYDIARDPIVLQMTPTGLRARTVARYTVQGCVAGRARPAAAPQPPLQHDGVTPWHPCKRPADPPSAGLASGRAEVDLRQPAGEEARQHREDRMRVPEEGVAMPALQ